MVLLVFGWFGWMVWLVSNYSNNGYHNSVIDGTAFYLAVAAQIVKDIFFRNSAHLKDPSTCHHIDCLTLVIASE